MDDAPLATLGGVGPLLLGEVEPGSLEEYDKLDRETNDAEQKDNEEQPHGA